MIFAALIYDSWLGEGDNVKSDTKTDEYARPTGYIFVSCGSGAVDAGGGVV
jgi:hypothetical protein